MNKNPYKLIFGKRPPEVVSRLSQTTMVLSAFRENPPDQQIYLITGLRGSGKTVFMTGISRELSKDDEWVVVELNSSENLLQDLAASLGSENNLAKIFQNAGINLSIFGIGLEVKGSVPISSIQVALTKMLEHLKKNGKKVLICIDEVTVTKYMKTFAGAFQIFLRQDLPVFLLMTGLYENINNLQNEKNLTFLYRAPKIEMKSLNLGMIADNYQKNFGLDYEKTEEMAKLTKGYPFAFQALGHFTWSYDGDYTKALSEYKYCLAEFVYDKIWSELSAGDRRFCTGLAKTENGKAKEVKMQAEISDDTYSVYRDRLGKRGIIDTSEFGYVQFVLPFFDEYVLRH